MNKVKQKKSDTHTRRPADTRAQSARVHLPHFSPRKGDFMAASTMPTSSCRLLGSWASPEAKAASASAWRPRY